MWVIIHPQSLQNLLVSPLGKYCKNRNIITFLVDAGVKGNCPTGTGARRRSNENTEARIKG